MLIVPDGSSNTGFNGLGAAGQQAMRDWVNGGGRLVAWSGGGALASRLGISSAQFSTASAEGLAVPGTMFRVRVNQASPLAAGVGPFAYAYHLGDYVMRQPDAAKAPLRYPPVASEDFFFSGYAEGEEALSETAAVSDERYGSGRAVVFGFEPNFRAFTDGTQRVLRNALLGADPATAGIAARPAARERAVASAERLAPVQSAMTLTVRRRGEAKARRALRRHRAAYRVYRTGGRTTYLIANPGEKVGDEHPYAQSSAPSCGGRRCPSSCSGRRRRCVWAGPHWRPRPARDRSPDRRPGRGESEHEARRTPAGPDRCRGALERRPGRRAGAGVRSVHAAELPRRGADRAAGARDRPRRPRRHDGRVRPLPARGRRAPARA